MKSNDNEKKYDDLTAIKGIGSARQQWLRESFGVRTFRDMAALTADEVELRLKAEGRLAARSEIEEWLVSARELAAVAEPPSPPNLGGAEAEADGSLSPAAKPTDKDAERKPPSSSQASAWKPFASFVVEFQARQTADQVKEQRIKVHYIEADEEKVWPVLEGKQLGQWMLEQVAAQKPSRPAEDAKVEAKAGAESPAAVEVTQIRVFQPPYAEKPLGLGQAGQAFPGFIGGGRPFALEVSFGFGGTTATDLANRRVRYLAQFEARNVATGESTHLGDAQPGALIEDRSAYSAVLPTARLPQGVYCLRTKIILDTPNAVPSTLEVPLLQVM